MTKMEIDCLKNSIDRLVEIETIDGEQLVARVVFVMHSEEYDEHDVQYEMISTNMPEAYRKPGDYVLDFEKIMSVKPHPVSDSQVLPTGS